MPQPNPKNLALSPAASDLGLGANLAEELKVADEDRKKKLMTQASGLAASGQLFGLYTKDVGLGY